RSSPTRSSRWSGPRCPPPSRGPRSWPHCASATRCSGRLATRSRPAHVARRLVLTQTEVGRVAELAVAGALGEAELRDQLRLDPDEIALARRIDERGLRAPTPAELPMEIGQRRLGEARADLARVAEPVAVEGADQEGSEMLASAARRREAADHELFLRTDLHLAPGRRALAGLVPGARVLADDAFQSPPPRLGERLQPIVRQPARDAQHGSFLHLRLEDAAAGRQRLAEQITAARVQTIEGDVDRRRGADRA